MQLSSFIALATFVASAVAHTTVYGVWVNGVFQGDGRNSYVRFCFVRVLCMTSMLMHAF